MLSMPKKRVAAAFLSLCLLAGLVLPTRAGAVDADTLQPDTLISETETPSTGETVAPETPESPILPEETETDEISVDETEDSSRMTVFETKDYYIDYDLTDTENPFGGVDQTSAEYGHQLRCTYVAWHEAKTRLGISLPNWGDAGSWAANAQAAGYQTGKNPAVNSIICWTSGVWGHVAYVNEVNGSTITVIEGGYGKDTYPKAHVRTIESTGSGGTADWSAGTFIYLNGSSTTPNPPVTPDPPATVVAEVESNDTLVTANSISVNTQVSGSLSKSSDKDWYAFTIPSDGYISLTFSHGYVDSTSHYWTTTFYTSANEALDSWTWQGKATTAITENNIGIVAGTYYVRVGAGPYTTWDSTDYHFVVNYTPANDWEKEFNETLIAANKISTNADVYGTLRSADDKDWYVFEIPSDGYISLSFAHDHVDSTSHYWTTTFYTSTNEVLDSWTWQGKATTAITENNIGIAAGMYYVRVSAGPYSTWDNADYHFVVNYTPSDKWEKEFNETLTTANKIPTNADIYGTLRSTDDKDWYVFEIPSDGYISLSFAHDHVDSTSHYWTTAFYTSANEALDSWTWQGRATTVITENNIGIAAGTYYVRVSAGPYSTWDNADYHFVVNYTPSNKWEKEFNETLTAANKISTNADVYGTIRSSSDKDWYVFTLPLDGDISLTFEHGLVNSSSAYWSTAFYTSGNESLQSWKWKGNTNAAATTDKISVTSGTYYICVADGPYDNWDNADYHFKVNYVLPDGTRPLPPLPIASKGGFTDVTAVSDGTSTVVTVDTATLSRITPAAGRPLVFAARGRQGAAAGTVNAATGEITFQTALKSGDKILFLHPGTYSPLIQPIILG